MKAFMILPVDLYDRFDGYEPTNEDICRLEKLISNALPDCLVWNGSPYLMYKREPNLFERKMLKRFDVDKVINNAYRELGFERR